MDEELSDAAKEEIREAVRIVREDRFERHAREVLGTHRREPVQKMGATSEANEGETGEVESQGSGESGEPGKEVKEVKGKTPPPKDLPLPAKKKVGLWGNYAE